MGVQMNIKSAEAVELARALAEKTGESLTQAVTVALRQRMQGLARDTDRAWREAEIDRVQAEVQKMMKEKGFTAADVWQDMEDMYDEHGLPR